MAGLADYVVDALSHDPVAALAEVELHIATSGPSPGASAVLAFIQILNCHFDGALATLPDATGALGDATAGFVAAVCLAEVPAPGQGDPAEEDRRGVHAFVTVEAAMSSGQITLAEELARSFVPGLTAIGGGTFWAWNQVALARSLAFQGRFTEAREEIDLVLEDRRSDQWPAVDRIARGVQAFVAAHAGDPTLSAAYAATLEDELPAPRTYLESASFVLAAFAEQAAGRAAGLDRLVLHGGGGRFLPRFQVVDRIYAYEILVESALARADLLAAGDWLDLAEAYPLDGHDMAGAAVARCRARIAIARDDPETGARESALSRERAAQAGGYLEVLRAQLLQAGASRGVDPAEIAELESVAALAASTGARTLRTWAARELALRGGRLRNVPGLGWEGLTDRQRLVALLAAQGLRNREIGDRLFVSERTVEGHIAAVLDALGAPSRVGIGRYLPPGTSRPSTALDALTPRQHEVARLVATGRTNAEIAATLTISEKTVEKHVADVFLRLKVQSRSAVAAAVRS
ncbi:helix-turn-helix transcriptional regulator [Nocardioides marmoriginsengisoli]|uniref:Helix-turn-helix transcriptional regulator n=1 Tax=Nocardioides marmoriginsengisoli TaxID=661483 RepID=A0A3N0CHT5_9ACTN|nr:LuxR C-terminal-related transcriptional regulator [Nocardioides marmoriginsengisoli]RNL62984.1 helix-turn-helix transcriptional regulator [Nocardioides marmoriginsengisoli]